MNGPGDIPLTLSSTPDTRPCSLISIIPTLGMSSCRGRAEAFARRLSSKLRTLGSQTEDDPISPEGEPIINGGTTNTWMSSHDGEQTVTDLQPLRHESDSFFDFDCELESPGSPVDECEYLRLIETASNTPHNSAESGYVCASSATSSHSSTDAATFHDAINHMECNTSNNINAITSNNINTNNNNINNNTNNSSSNSNNISNSSSNNNIHGTSPARNLIVACDVLDYVNAEKLTNGHTNHDTEKSSPTLTPSSIHTHELDNGQDTYDSTTADQSVDEQHTAEQNSSPPSHEICEKEMIQMQADIINDLQKQSVEYRNEEEQKVETKNENEKGVEEGETHINKTEEANELSSVAPTTPTPTHTTELRESTSEPEKTVEQNNIQQQQTVHTIIMQTCESVEPNEEVLKVEIITSTSENHKNETPETPQTPETPELPAIPTIPAQLNGSECAETLKSSAEISASTTTTTTAATAAKTTTIAKTTTNGNEQHTSPNISEASVKTAKLTRNSAPLDTTDDEDECRPQRVRRCSSLKTGKTPPGTPGRKKIVRFADVLGLDLADIKTFLDEVPTIPKSAFEDLEIMESEPPLQLGPKSDKLLMPLFQQPGGLATFLDIVREKLVSLENAAVTDNVNQTITGSVRVRNLDFHKSVHIRYSLDGWRSFADLQANYVQNSCDGFSDKFTFVLFGNTLHIGQRLEFAVRFQCKGQQFWDNNYGANYCFQCLPSSSNAINQPLHPIMPPHHSGQAITGMMLSPTVGEAWCSSFY